MPFDPFMMTGVHTVMARAVCSTMACQNFSYTRHRRLELRGSVRRGGQGRSSHGKRKCWDAELSFAVGLCFNLSCRSVRNRRSVVWVEACALVSVEVQQAVGSRAWLQMGMGRGVLKSMWDTTGNNAPLCPT